MALGRSTDQRPGNPQFPATWAMGLAKEGLRGKLGRWRNFRCGGFEIYGEELADWPTNVSCPNPNNGGTEEEGEELGIERDRARAAEVDEDVQDAGAAGKRGGAPPLTPPAPMFATRQPAMQKRSPEENTGLTGPQYRSDRLISYNFP